MSASCSSCCSTSPVGVQASPSWYGAGLRRPFYPTTLKQVTVVNNVCLWAFLFRPVVNVLFRHKQALHAFKEGMTFFVDL